jgi:hypothetical protein
MLHLPVPYRASNRCQVLFLLLLRLLYSNRSSRGQGVSRLRVLRRRGNKAAQPKHGYAEKDRRALESTGRELEIGGGESTYHQQSGSFHDDVGGHWSKPSTTIIIAEQHSPGSKKRLFRLAQNYVIQ